jgi:hypothetical protein
MPPATTPRPVNPYPNLPGPKKKRGCVPWLIGGVVALAVIVVVAVAASSSSTKNDTSTTAAAAAGLTTTAPGSATSISQGIGSQDATADVSGIAMTPPDSIGAVYVTATITNHSSGRSDYVIQVNVESPDGKTKYDDTTLFAQNVEPGQTTTVKSPLTTDPIPAEAVVRPTQIQRTASS